MLKWLAATRDSNIDFPNKLLKKTTCLGPDSGFNFWPLAQKKKHQSNCFHHTEKKNPNNNKKLQK